VPPFGCGARAPYQSRHDPSFGVVGAIVQAVHDALVDAVQPSTTKPFIATL
jgi:hypothetical protein